MPKKVKTTVVVDGFEREVEIEVPDGPPVAWGDPASNRIIGRSIQRLDGADKVTGRAKYTYDVKLPGLLYARVLRSPYAAAQIDAGAVDVSAARRIPGVKAVITLDQPSGKTLRYVGDEIAAVAATTPEIAEDAIRAIKVTYRPLPFVVDPEKAAAPGAPQVRPNSPNVVPALQRGQVEQTRGDVSSGFSQAATTFEGTFEAQVRLHCCLETHGHVCKWDGDRLTVWASTQAVHGSRPAFATYFRIPPENVRVITEHMGGGFGSKFGPNTEGILCARLAKEAGAPVKLMLTRWDEQTGNFNGPGARATFKAGASRDGKIVAWESAMRMFGGVNNGQNSSSSGPYIYAVDNVKARAESVFTNTGGSAALRAPGHPQGSFLTEMVVDELAYKLGMDPLEFRSKNLAENNPRTPWYREEMAIGARRIGWDRRNRTPGAGTGPKRRGMGLALATWGGGGGANTTVDLTIGKDGAVVVSTGTQDIGTGTRTYVAMIVAEEFGLPLSAVVPRIGDTTYPPSGGSGGSNTTPSVAPSVKMAAVDGRDQFAVALAGHMSSKPENLVFRDGKVMLKDNPSKSMTWKEACAKLPARGIVARGTWNADLAVSGVAGVQFAEVEVDVETGLTRVLKVVAVHDCGRVMNKLTTESQIFGAVVQGIAQALLERRHEDTLTGRILNANFEEYKLTGAMDIPAIEVILYDPNHGRVSGIGEPAIVPTASAIANAIYNATGVRVPELPATPDIFLAAAAAQKGGRA
jgi:xanthine dehydrogenase YagR molybdenum-binding subunit